MALGHCSEFTEALGESWSRGKCMCHMLAQPSHTPNRRWCNFDTFLQWGLEQTCVLVVQDTRTPRPSLTTVVMRRHSVAFIIIDRYRKQVRPPFSPRLHQPIYSAESFRYQLTMEVAILLRCMTLRKQPSDRRDPDDPDCPDDTIEPDDPDDLDDPYGPDVPETI